MSFAGNLKKWLDAEFYLKDQTEDQPPFQYSLRRSQRARHLQIRVLPIGKVEVVLPPRCSESRGHALAKEKAEWIQKALLKLASQRKELDHSFPEAIKLLATAEIWPIKRQRQSNTTRVQLREKQGQLVLSGATKNEELCISVLKKWLSKKARKELVPWLDKVSEETRLPYNKASIRGQKTRWGSCSTQKNISLNYKLLLVPPEQVRYLFIHELSHTRHMNHSKAFWAQVAKLEPDYKHLDKALNRATREAVPGWLHG